MTTHSHGHHGGTTTTAPKTVHRWVVFGAPGDSDDAANRVYLSHLSMFSMPEHAMQVIVSADLHTPDGSPSTAYADDRRSHPAQRLYTLDPELFVLPDILPSDSEPPRRDSLQADLYRDHVEKNNPQKERIARGVTVHIKDIVHARDYDADAQPLADLEYLVLGSGTDTYLAHFITRPPDFDQIIAVSIDGGLGADPIDSGVRLTVPGRANTIGDRLTEGGQAVQATLHGPGGDTTVTIRPGVEYYLNSDQDMQ